MPQGSICPSCGLQVASGVEVCPNDGTLLRGVDRTLAPRDPLIGTEVGGFRIEELVGSGGLGLVYRGEQAAIGKPVAIKVLRWEFANNPQEVRRLMTEAKAVNAIRHRGIVDIFSMGQLPDGRHYLVMELLEGEPLDKVISARSPLPPLEVADILDELLDALGAAHRAGVVHRDLKPSNIFRVTPQYGAPYLKLLDFGLAKQTEVQVDPLLATRSSVIVGTPLYMAPEQAKGELISPQTDLYAVGVILFELLTGKPPFVASNVYDTISKHLNAPVPLPSESLGTSGGPFDGLVTRLMSKDPRDRPASAVHVREEVRLIAAELRGEKPSARAESYRGFEETLRSGSSRRVAHVWRRIVGKKEEPRRSGSLAPAPRATRIVLAAALVGCVGAIGLQRWLSAPEPAPSVATIPSPEPTPVATPAVEPPARPEEPKEAQPPVAVPAAATEPPAQNAEPTSVVTVSPQAPEHPVAPKPKPREPKVSPALAQGTLKLHVFPWADIYVDDQLREKGAMDLELELRAGRHVVRLVNPNLAQQTETVTVVGGQTVEKRFRLKKNDGP